MRREAARYELVDLLFSLVWVPGKHLVSLLGHGLKSLGTTVLEYFRMAPLDLMTWTLDDGVSQLVL